VTVLYDLFDLARPARDSRTFESSNWNAVRGGCSGNTTLTGVEYHHVSSVTVGVESNLLASSRTLNTVWIPSNHWFGGSPPNFRTLYLGQIEVDSADFWTDRLLSSSSQSTAESLALKRSHTRTLKSG